MARIIEFEGKTIKTGQWVTGNLSFANSKYNNFELQYHDSVYIEEKGPSDYVIRYLVIPETVGQYTNVIGSNGKKIYDHNIVSNGNIEGEVYWNYSCNGWRVAATNEKNALYDTKLDRTFCVVGHKYDQLIPGAYKEF